jgi:hypothetical protein
MFKKYLSITITILIPVLFAYIAITKLLNYNMFRHIISVSPTIGKKAGDFNGASNPSLTTTIITLTIIMAMVWIAFLIVSPKSRLLGFYASTILQLLISLYLAYVVCFVTIEDFPFSGMTRPRLGFWQMTWKQLLVFNITLLLLSFMGILLHRNKTKKETSIEIPNASFA